MATKTTSPSAPSTNAVISVPRVRFISAFIYLVTFTIFFVSGAEILPLYRTAMFASIFNELLTLKMCVPMITMNPEVLNLISASPALPHLLLSIFLWLNSSKFSTQMTSIAIVYIYQALEYIPTDSTILKNSLWISYGRSFTEVLMPRKISLLRIAAHLELLTLVLILVSIIRMKGSLIDLLVYTQYLTSQYILSPTTTQAIQFWDTIVSRLLNDPRCPEIVKTGDTKLREYLAKLVEFTKKILKPSEPTTTTPLRKR